MIGIPLIFLILYIVLVMYVAKRVEIKNEIVLKNEIHEKEKIFNKLDSRKEYLYITKNKLEEEAVEIYTLYEITREIARSQNEEEAFDIFKEKLSKHIKFEECVYFDISSKEIKKLKTDNEYFIFTLQGKTSKIGYVAIKGLSNEDREKVMILGHQFALSLRRVNLYQEIEKVAITDSLTEVHTRRYTLERFQEELNRSKSRNIKTSLLMIDVDHFKNFNDTYGHLTGDLILREIGYIIRENVREIDIAGRYGGEEFCVVLPDTDRNGAQFAAERIRQAANKNKIKAYDTEVKVTLSIGISTFPADGKNQEEIIDKADWALYRAKKTGRNRVCCFGHYEEDS